MRRSDRFVATVPQPAAFRQAGTVIAVRATPKVDSPAENAVLVALLARMAAADQAALAQLYDSTSSRVFGLLSKLLGDPVAAEEVAHDVFLQAWRSAPDYDGARGTVLAWLLMIARSRALDYRRRQRARVAHEAAAPEADWLAAAQEATGAPMQDGALARRVQRALLALPLEQRRAVTLAFFAERSHREVAEELGLPLGTVKTQIRTALIRLRAALADLSREDWLA